MQNDFNDQNLAQMMDGGDMQLPPEVQAMIDNATEEQVVQAVERLSELKSGYSLYKTYIDGVISAVQSRNLLIGLYYFSCMTASPALQESVRLILEEYIDFERVMHLLGV